MSSVQTPTLFLVDDTVVTIKLDAAEAFQATEILLHLAALIETDDPDGLRDA